MKNGKWILILSIFFMIFNTGCSTSVKFAYNRADWFILKQISDFACLEKEQKNAVGKEIANFMVWHRKEELPVYAENMNSFAKVLQAGPVTKEAFEKMYVFFEDTQIKTTNKIKDFGIDFVMSLSQDQIQCSLDKLEKNSKERKKELEMDREKYIKKMKKQMSDQAETWLGSVTSEQTALIDSVIASQEEEKEAETASTRKKEYMKIVLLMPNSPEKRTKILELINDPYAVYTEKEKSLIVKRRERSKDGIWKLLQTLIEKQRTHLAGELTDYAQKFKELSEE